jgi:hypothetical protein
MSERKNYLRIDEQIREFPTVEQTKIVKFVSQNWVEEKTHRPVVEKFTNGETRARKKQENISRDR